MGFANGVAPVFSYQFGAKGYVELLRLLRLSLGIIFLFGILSFAAANIFAVPLMTLFLPDGGRAYALALGGFGLFSWSFLLCGFNLFSSTALPILVSRLLPKDSFCRLPLKSTFIYFNYIS